MEKNQMTFQEACCIVADFFLTQYESGRLNAKNLFPNYDDAFKVYFSLLPEDAGPCAHFDFIADIEPFFNLMRFGSFGERREEFMRRYGMLATRLLEIERMRRSAHAKTIPLHVQGLQKKDYDAVRKTGVFSHEAETAREELRRSYPIPYVFYTKYKIDLEAREGLYTAMLRDLGYDWRDLRNNGRKLAQHNVRHGRETEIKQ